MRCSGLFRVDAQLLCLACGLGTSACDNKDVLEAVVVQSLTSQSNSLFALLVRSITKIRGYSM